MTRFLIECAFCENFQTYNCCSLGQNMRIQQGLNKIRKEKKAYFMKIKKKDPLRLQLLNIQLARILSSNLCRFCKKFKTADCCDKSIQLCSSCLKESTLDCCKPKEDYASKRIYQLLSEQRKRRLAE